MRISLLVSETAMRVTLKNVLEVVLLCILTTLTVILHFWNTRPASASYPPSYRVKSRSAFPFELSPQLSSRPSQYPWKRHIKQRCQNYPHPNFHAAIPQYFDHFLVDDKHKLIYCQIPKVATTSWRRAFIVMSGKVGTTDLMAIKAEDVHTKYNQVLSYLSDYPENEVQHKLRTYFKFVFVREPFERLLSAFRNKFHSIFPKQIEFFYKKYGNDIISQYRENDSNDLEYEDRVTFSEFIDYLVDSARAIPLNEHWEQFYTLCRPCVVDYDYIGKLESLVEDSNFILKQRGLENIIKFPNREEAGIQPKQSNFLLKEYYSKIPKNKLLDLWDAYKKDFDIFNYTIPDDIKRLMN